MKRDNFLYIGIFVCIAWALLVGWLFPGRGEDTVNLAVLGGIMIMIPAVLLWRAAGK